ncbi:MAG: DMT family transporter [Corynebacteriales bacterium]|nr:DMT family transporter [Mycobacteriales bacterium]
MQTALLAAALLIGGLLALQASVNLQLGKAVGTPYGASTLQLGIATALLGTLGLATGTLGAINGIFDVPTWQLLGGLASPLYIMSGILLFPRLGALASVGLFVTGQMFASLSLDLFGWFGLDRKPFSPGIALGALALLGGIVVIIKGQSTGTGTKMSKLARTGWYALGIIAGAVLPIQGAINAKLRTELDEPLAAATVSFAVATLTIAVVLAALWATKRTPSPQVKPLRTMPWWGWLGGAAAAVYVTGTFLLIPEIGAAVTVALTVTGQQLTSALIDHRGYFRLPQRQLNRTRQIGLGLLLVGAVAIQLF